MPRRRSVSYLKRLREAQEHPEGKTVIMVGTALAQGSPIFPVMCSVHGPTHHATIAGAARYALAHGERFHKHGGYTIEYTPTAKIMLVNEANMEAKLAERQKVERL